MLDYTKEDYLKMDNYYNGEPFNSIIIVPTGEFHDSGFQCMKYIFTYGLEKIVGVQSGWSDILHLNGIGGYGLNISKALDRGGYVKVIDWCVDCLPNGLVRVFCKKDLTILSSYTFSDYCVFTMEEVSNESGL